MAREYTMNFCPVCAARLERRVVYGKERPACPNCRFIHFCDPKVAAITLVEQDGRVLLTRRAFNPAKGRWTLPGGFVDCGEDPRDAAVRECLEETGLEIGLGGLVDLYYGKAHVDGADIVIVYAGRLAGGTMAPGDDVDAVAFFSPDTLPELAFASTEEILAGWQKRQGHA
jgi:ADP-ribose pyrophosphatase YjhB (NUDIX family)